MEHRTLEITLNGAKDLKKVNLFCRFYGVVSISGGPANPKQIRCPVDTQGNRNPNRNFPMKFTIDAATAEQNRLTLNFKLRSRRFLVDREIGEVHVPLKELLSGDGKSDQFVSYPVSRPSGRTKGELYFSYKFGAVAKSDEPVTGYPAGHPAAGYPAGHPAAYAATYSGGSYARPPGYSPQPGYHQPAGHPAAYAATYSGGSYARPPGYSPQPGYHQPAGYPAAYAATDSGGTYGYPPQQVYGYPLPGYPPKPGYHQPAGYPAAYAATDSGGSYTPPSGYPPQPGYHQPAGHPAAYAATDSGGTYGYPPPVQKPKKNKMALGLGPDLLGHWVIGNVIENMIPDDGPDDGGFDGLFDF